MPLEQANFVTENMISRFIQKTEAEILQYNDWNLETFGNGSDILNMILKLSNDEYDFGKIIEKVDRESIN
jgi:hypothetical protein